MRAKSPPIFQPIAASSSSIDERVPEPGLPTLKRLPLKSSNLVMFASLRATTVKGSGCKANTARMSLIAPSFLNAPSPLVAKNCTSDCDDAELDFAGFQRLTLATDPPVDSTEQRMPCLARSRLTRRQIAPPAG